MVAANDTVAGDEDVDAIGPDSLCHGSHSPCVVNRLGYLHVASGFYVWDVE